MMCKINRRSESNKVLICLLLSLLSASTLADSCDYPIMIHTQCKPPPGIDKFEGMGYGRFHEFVFGQRLEDTNGLEIVVHGGTNLNYVTKRKLSKPYYGCRVAELSYDHGGKRLYKVSLEWHPMGVGSKETAQKLATTIAKELSYGYNITFKRLEAISSDDQTSEGLLFGCTSYDKGLRVSIEAAKTNIGLIRFNVTVENENVYLKAKEPIKQNDDTVEVEI